MKNLIIWIIFSIFQFTKCQIPAIFFPPNFVRHEFRRIGPEVDPACPPLRCAPVAEGCAQPQVIMVNGRRCPFCPRNICTDSEPPREGLEGNRILLSIAESNSRRERNNSPSTSTRDTEHRTDRQTSRFASNGQSSPDSDSPFFAPNERRIVRTGQQGVRGTRVDPPVRRRSGPSRNRSPSTGSRARPEGRPGPTEPAEKAPSKIPPVENQQNAHILFPLEPFRENVIGDPEPKSNKNEKSQKRAPVKAPVTPAPTKPLSTPAPTHGTRSGRQTRPNVGLLFQALNRIGSLSRNQQSNTNQPNRPQQTSFLPPLRALAGSPFTQVVQRGTQNDRQNGNTQSSNPQRPAMNGIHPLLPLFLLQQARLNSLNAPSPTATPNTPNNAAQNTPPRNNAANLPQLPPHLRAMMPFPFFNPTANQNTIPGMTMQANQAAPGNGEPTVPPVSPTVQAEINQWMDQMAMPIQEVLGEVSPSQSGSQPQTNINQIQRGQMTSPVQQMLNVGQQQNPQTQQARIPNPAFFQQWLQQMALQRQRLAAGQVPAQITPQGAQSNWAAPQTPNFNLLFQNMDPSRRNTAAQTPVNQAASASNNAAGSNGGFSQWLDSLATQIQHQLEGGSNPVQQTNAVPQQLVNNVPINMNNMLQNMNNVPSPNGGGGEVNFNNWLENMVAPIQQELTRSPGNPQTPPSRGGADIPASTWINEMLDPIQQGLGRR